MKKLYFLLLLCSSVAMAAPPVIQNPSPFHICDDNYDGVASFDLNDKNPEILGSLSSSQYGVNYYETFADANNDVNSVFPLGYNNIQTVNQVVFVRVYEFLNPSNFATTTLELLVDAKPVAYQAPDLIAYESPSDGSATFDLSSNDAAILNGQAGLQVGFFITQADAESGASQVPNTFVNFANPQTIWVRVLNLSTGCFTISSFNVAVLETGAIYIPDAAFKAKLISDGVDTNGDGDIQVTEAAPVTEIYVNNLNISSLVGVESFPALEILSARDNQLTSLNVAGLNNLKVIDCSINNPGIANFIHTGVTGLRTLRMSGNKLASLDLTGMTVLDTLDVTYNNITTLDVSPAVSLKKLECYFNFYMSSLTLNNPDLEMLNCSNNHIASLDFSGVPALKHLACANNFLTSLDFTGLPNLVDFVCNWNQITSINFGDALGLTDVYCGSNQLTSLDVSMLPEMTTLNCPNNLLTTLDCSQNHHLQYLQCYSNLLETLFIKNGSDEAFDSANWGENPTLAYICADESQLLSLVTAVGNENVSVNSYCSVEPGAPYNTITGTMRLDVDGNGCDGSDALARFVKLDVTGSDGQGSVYTNADGIYTIYTGAGDTSVSTSFENSNYFDLVLPFSHNFPLVDGSTFTQDICLSPSGPHPDLEVVIAPISPARPGFEAAYRIVYKNKGNQVMSSDTPAVFFNFDANHMTFLESDTAPEQVSAGSLGWSYADLQPFESRVITIAMQVNAPTNPTFPVNVGDHLAFNSQISPIATDDSPIDNNFDYNQTVVGSYDPNDMYCIEGDVVAPDQIGNYLHYVINFENTGTDIAENVVVTDEILASQYDINSLQVVNSSDDVDISVDGGKVTFFFHDIKLPIGGHGNILLKIKSNGALAEGDSVLNNANIFFDYNLPIATNNAETLFQLLGLPDQQIDNAITIFPNPSHGMVNIKAATNIQSVQVYDVQGRLLQTSLRNGNDVSVDISSQQTGVYFLKITSDKGIKTERILKN